MGTTLSTFQYALKTLWPQSEVFNLVYKKNPFLALVPKDESFDGDSAYIALEYGDNNGRSHTFSNAQSNRDNVKGRRFLLTRKSDYATAEITTEVLRASKSNKGALVSALQREVKSALNGLKRSLGVDVYGSGTGTRGQVGVQATSPITMDPPSKISNIEVGMKLVASTTDGGALIDSGNAITVTGVNRSAGTFTFTGSISGLGVGDYLYVQGDAKNNSTQKAITGLAGWLPFTAPSPSEDFMGVDRSVDTVRLAGNRMDISSYTLAEGMVKFGNVVAREQGDPDYLFCNHETFGNFELEAGAKVQYVDVDVGEIGFRGIRITAGEVSVNVLPDVNCPATLAYMIQMNTWKLRSLGACPGPLDDDGLQMLRLASGDGVELRYGYYAELGCTAPGWNGVARLPS